MNYVGIRRGQNMPITGIAQKLLNRHGAGLTVDGAFGRRTWMAVRDFQRLHGLGVDGIIGQRTWPRLVGTLSLPIGDAVDDFEKKTPGNDGYETPDLKAAGADLYRSPKASMMVGHVIRDMIGHFRGANLTLLRLHGHGYPGYMSVVGGLLGDDDYASLNNWILRAPNAAEVLGEFRSVLGPMGSIALNGCRTGRGREGSKLLQTLATFTGFPVVAGVTTQLAVGSATFYMEGPVKVRFPDPRMSLRDWCDRLPEFPPLLGSGYFATPQPLTRIMECRPAF